MSNRPTFRIADKDYPPTIVDAIGAEPVSVMAGDAHVKLYTWHGVTPPYTEGNAQVLYVAVSDAYTLADCLGQAADHVVATALDRKEGGNTA